MARLIALSYSPWSEKARWALDHHRVEYAEREHVPMLGEPVLRLLARRPFGRVSVPLFLDGPLILGDSLQIARHADHVGRGAPLFPPGQDEAIAAWNRRSDVVMGSGRARLIGRIVRDPEALSESVPAFVPAPLRAAMRPLAAMGAQFLARKYRTRSGDAAERERQLLAIEGVLVQLREALAANRGFVVGAALTYADIAMAVALQVVRPVDDRFIALGPATRAVWTEPQLVGEFADLLEWRDRLYAEHRR
jgi:glutathione S-transferase